MGPIVFFASPHSLCLSFSCHSSLLNEKFPLSLALSISFVRLSISRVKMLLKDFSRRYFIRLLYSLILKSFHNRLHQWNKPNWHGSFSFFQRQTVRGTAVSHHSAFIRARCFDVCFLNLQVAMATIRKCSNLNRSFYTNVNNNWVKWK